MAKKRRIYGAAFLALLAIEILIALFVHDRFIRPYGGDILVTVLLCCLGRIFFPEKPKLALSVEICQYFDFVTRLGLGNSPFFRTLLGTTFSPADILCYGAGCALFTLGEIPRKNT